MKGLIFAGLAAVSLLVGCGSDPSSNDDAVSPTPLEETGTPAAVVSPTPSPTPVDTDGDGHPAGDDCDDKDNNVYPGATEVCDGEDNNCNGQFDEGVTTTYYYDRDLDGYGDPANTTTEACSKPTGYVIDNTDCNDANAAVHPGATERCNSIDDDCDEQFDEAGKYVDADHDGYGDPNTTHTCATSPGDGSYGYVIDNTDCNDANAAVHPGATEACDGNDNDCDGITGILDEDASVGLKLWFLDADGDSFSGNGETYACQQPTGYLPWDPYTGTDCNDNDAAVHPLTAETCNSIDDDCDKKIDEGVTTSSYPDADGDGYGNGMVAATITCTQPAGYVTNNTDCNDGNAWIYPGATETTNGKDDDCDGEIDNVLSTYYKDRDGDGYGSGTPYQTYDPQEEVLEGYVPLGGDCDDADRAINPGAKEVVNGIDDDCDGEVDE